ncbi:MAG: type II toxin-antitoxin system VapC family toxin [Alphaproteobacteria bacterium]
MRLLLDTCTFLWWMAEPQKLSPEARLHLIDHRNDIVLSAVSGWEIALKNRLGKLTLDRRPAALVDEAVARLDLTILPVSMAHGIVAGELPLHHKDPFDRLLIAQAEIDGLTLISPDSAFMAYKVKMLW